MKQSFHCLQFGLTTANGIVYHRNSIVGDYDDFDDVEKLIYFIKNGKGKNFIAVHNLKGVGLK